MIIDNHMALIFHLIKLGNHTNHTINFLCLYISAQSYILILFPAADLLTLKNSQAPISTRLLNQIKSY